MKRLLLAVALMFAIAPMAVADEESCDFVHVWVDVVSNIAVQAIYPTMDLGDIQTGRFYGLVPFRIDANTQTILAWAAVSNLYKGNDPENPEVNPILVYLPYGVFFEAQMGNPTGGLDNNVEFIEEYDVNGFPGFVTEMLEIESSQSGHFSQELTMECAWLQDDHEKPMGEYSGNVMLCAMIVLP